MMDALTFISDICGQLKTIKRTGWVRSNIPYPESISDHMHRCGMCAMLLSQPPDPKDDYSMPTNEQYHPNNVDATKLLRMAVTHDLCESIAGDITPFCDAHVVQSKFQKEHEAMRSIQKVIGDPLGEELFNLWKEYEEQTTTEAVYCKDIDKFEMIVQAYEYEKEHLRFQNEEKEDISNIQQGDGEKATTTDNNDEKGTKMSRVSTTGMLLEPLRTFFITTNGMMKTPLFKRLDKELRCKRGIMLEERGWSVTEEEYQKD